jgi:hypothetical protein
MSNNIIPPISKTAIEKFEEYIKLSPQWNRLSGPPAALGAAAGRPTGSSLKDKDSIVQETVERLSEAIAKLCNRYNFSDSVQMTTQVDLVETANYTTVILTATIEWLPNPYVFVAQEKVKTSNKTASSPLRGATLPAAQAQNLTKQMQMEQMQKQAEARKKHEEMEKKYGWLDQQEPPF